MQRRLHLLLVLLAFSCLVGRGEALAAAPPDTPGEVWVTLGGDGFDRLLRAPGILSQALPPVAVERRSGVVLTRLAARDLPAVSSLMHADFDRCSGFIAHDSYEDAHDTLMRLDQVSDLTLPTDFRISQQAVTSQLLDDLDAARILGTISHLSTAYNNRFHANVSGQQAALWIRDLWLQYAAGRSDVSVETVTHSTLQPSVVLTINGTSLPDEVVVLGAHLDSIKSGATNTDPATIAPGADDDASGIATLSEVIRSLLSNGFTPDRTVKLIGYAAEEVGLVGSGAIAADAVANGTEVVAVLQLDMTGYNGSVEDVALIDDYTNADLTAFVGSLIDAYLPELQWTTTTCGYACSDHASWHNRGFPAAFPFEARFGQYNPQIHTSNDDLVTLGNSADHALKFAKIATAFTAETALVDCTQDADCDDSAYCNGIESCVVGSCQSGPPPCGGGACDEPTDSCTSICGDGTCDAGETCSSCAADCPSFPLPTAVCGNGLCEAGDGEDCVSCAADCNGAQSGKPANRFCCGFGGSNPVGCSSSTCTTGGFSCTETPQGAGGSTCCGDLICQDPEDSSNCSVDCGTPAVCGDGTCDVGESSCSCTADCGAPPSSELGLCSDGMDNDCDGFTDCADNDCLGDSACQAVDCSAFGTKSSCNAEPSCRWSNRDGICIPR